MNLTGLEEEEYLNDPFIDHRLRSEQPITPLECFELLHKLWEKAGFPGKIMRVSPFDQVKEFPVIMFKMIHRSINGQFKDMKPRYRTTIRHPYANNEFVELRGQIFDVVVEFDVYALSQTEADLLVEKFDDFMLTYKGYLKYMGVQEILFYQQLSDEVVQDSRYPIACRPVQYKMRFEKISPIFLNQLNQLNISAKVNRDRINQLLNE